MKQFYPPFLEHIRRHRLIHPQDTILLAFSGGKDSVTLFHLLKELQKDLTFELKVVYFNHRLRKDAGEEQAWVETFCREQGVELIVGSKKVMEFMTRAGLNLEHAASLSRYAFFREVSSRFKNAGIATAHTRSDLTETFFIKLFRGSGLQGLSAIFSKKENTIIRPLLLFTQEQVLDFLKRNHFPYYRDPTNEEDLFLRNRIRRHIVPEIEKIEPGLHQHVFRTVGIIQDEYDYFYNLAHDILEKELLLGKVLPAQILKPHHVALQRHIVREYLRLLKGNLLNIGFDHIEAIRTGYNGMRGLAVPGVELKFHKGFIFPAGFTVPNYRYEIPSTGRHRVPEIEEELVIEETAAYEKPADNHRIVIPAAKAVFPLLLRSPERADKYRKLNTGINQKVFEMIRSSGTPSALRNLCPVLVNGDGEIIWVPGSPVADAFKVAEGEKGPFFVFGRG